MGNLMTEPNAAKAEALAHLQAVVNDPAADPVRRDKVAIALAQIARAPSSAAVRAGGNGHAPAPVIDPAAPMTMHDALGTLAWCVGELGQRLIALEQRNAKLEAALAEKTAYRELWKAESSYRQNDEVTFKGQLWHCNYETTDRPGTSGAWRLKHKRENL